MEKLIVTNYGNNDNWIYFYLDNIIHYLVFIYTKMKLTLNKKLLGLLYYCVTREMERCDRTTPKGRLSDLMDLEVMLNSLLIK